MTRTRFSDRAEARTAVISVTFLNFTIDQHKWTIVDVGTGQTVFDNFLEARGNEPNDRVTVTLVSDGVVGNAKYKREDSDFTNASLLTDGQEVLMT